MFTGFSGSVKVFTGFCRSVIGGYWVLWKCDWWLLGFVEV